MILLAVSITAYAYIFSKTFMVNCDGTVQNTRPVEVVLDITATPKLEIFTTTTTTSITTITSTTSTTTTTTTTMISTTQTACGFWGCDHSESNYDSSTANDGDSEDSGWGFNWGN